MRMEGTVKDGVVILDPTVKIPDGTRVTIEVRKDAGAPASLPNLPFPVMTDKEGCISPSWVASLPPDRREAVLRAAAEDAANDYQTDPELTEFTRAVEGEDFEDNGDQGRDLAGHA